MITARNTAAPAHSAVKKHRDGSSLKITVTNYLNLALSLIAELLAFGEAFRWNDGIHTFVFTRNMPNLLHCDNSQVGVESLL